ncbi:DUF3179 domain-containing (seleno)protein [Arcicella rosea]|uniref:DUF3179 domain-containing protein n=1 Tax=Arcicella rosea TaxID=502909 RepID=A0A841EHC6_9BACT|nr:DUF3179 domain-containing (seleno)protein [Arcicella rosea]MBB6001674.1 hypothetical protein [Arcicella rosea]
MKKLFYLGIIGLIIFEILNVYFIMPMPGSQQMRSIDIAYFLYTWRWIFRGIFGVMIVFGIFPAFQQARWFTLLGILFAAGVCYAFNFKMAADAMFEETQALSMKPASENQIKLDRVIIGVELNGEAKAYPISQIIYHHQVCDTLAGKLIMVTYCSVCRTGRVFEPIVNGKVEAFRLVGMDHFNAMFEDNTTKSWWRQANGEAITGELKGTMLPELVSQQVSLDTWLKMYPTSKIMQPDLKYKEEYDSTAKYESGKSKKKLTGTDSLSWKDKSWVVGIQLYGESKAFDWNRLKKERIIQTNIGKKAVILVLADDNKSFFAFLNPTSNGKFSVKNDTLIENRNRYNLKGENLEQITNKQASLIRIKAYQEFWHSWKTFHPDTQEY